MLKKDELGYFAMKNGYSLVKNKSKMDLDSLEKE